MANVHVQVESKNILKTYKCIKKLIRNSKCNKMLSIKFSRVWYDHVKDCVDPVSIQTTTKQENIYFPVFIIST